MKAELILLKNLQLRMAEIDESLHPLVIRAMQEYSDHSAKERFDRAMEHYRNIPVGDIVIKRGVSLKAKEALQIAAYGDTKTEEG